MLIDTHCHLDFPEFNQDRTDVIERARNAGVGYIINIGSSVEGSRRAVELAGESAMIYATVGIHPHYANDTGGKVPDELRALVKENKVVAIGETGLDYYRKLSPKELQKSLFTNFIDLAKENGLPLVIHTREAHEETLNILKAYSLQLKAKIRGVMHCFSADENYLKEFLKMGFYISFTCNLTYKNAKNLRHLAKKVPAERLLLETDAPFLAPQEFRGERNEPSYITHLVKELAQIHGLSEEDIARITTHNAKALFGLPIQEDCKIAYPIKDSLYLNITNRCTNDCDFCIRKSTDFVKGHNLKLDKEPTAEDLIEVVGDPTRYKEIVFCGYGEPTLRLDVIKIVAGYLKKRGVRVRIVTNGQGNLIHKRSIVKELIGLIDKVSVSLNVDNECMYNKMCKSIFGNEAFERVKDFVRECRDAGLEVEVTFLDLPGVDERNCAKIARDELKVDYRMRRLNIVG